MENRMTPAKIYGPGGVDPKKTVPFEFFLKNITDEKNIAETKNPASHVGIKIVKSEPAAEKTAIPSGTETARI